MTNIKDEELKVLRKQRIQEILDPIKNPPLLLVIDMQRDYMGHDGKAAQLWKSNISHMEDIVPTINSVVNLFHKLGMPVIRTQMFEDLESRGTAELDRALFFDGTINKETEEAAIACQKGTPGAELVLPATGNDIVMEKTTPSALTPELRAFIQDNKIGTVFITGVKTQRCVFSTVVDLYKARDLGIHKNGIHVVVLEDCVASDDERLAGIPGHISFLEELKQFYPPVLTSQQLFKQWEPLNT